MSSYDFLQNPERWYQGDTTLVVPTTQLRQGGVVCSVSEAGLPEGYGNLSTADVEERLREMNDTWKIIECEGHRFEIGVVNSTAPGSHTVHVSTYSSSLLKNPGNAWEHALAGAADPSSRRVYVASLGNGGSQYFSDAEAAHLRRTGRVTEDHNGVTRALPTIGYLAAGLKNEGYDVKRITSDSSGGIIGSGLAVALGGVKALFCSGRPQVSDLSPLGLALRHTVGEGVLNGRRYGGSDADPLRVNKERRARAAALMPRVYGEDNRRRVEELMQGRQPKGKMRTDLASMSRGPRRRDPLGQDTQAVLNANTDIAVSIIAGRRDPLYNQRRADEEVGMFLGGLSLPEGCATVAVYRPDLYHAFHTALPAARIALERIGFSRS